MNNEYEWYPQGGEYNGEYLLSARVNLGQANGPGFEICSVKP